MSFRKYASGDVIPPEDADESIRVDHEKALAEREAMSNVDVADVAYADNDRLIEPE